jgi:hypothetical protein
VLAVGTIGVVLAFSLSSGHHHVAPAGIKATKAPSGGVTGINMSSMPGMNMAPPPAPKNLPASTPCTARTCPIPEPGGNTLSVAGRLGSAMATAWITPVAGRSETAAGSGQSTLQVRVELVNTNLHPVVEPTTFAGNPTRIACGPGCWTLRLTGRQRAITITGSEHGHVYRVSLPLQWTKGQSAQARALVQKATSTMQALPGLGLDEMTGSGVPGVPGNDNHVRFLLRAPNAMSATVTGYADRQVTIGATQWSYSTGVGWVTGEYADGQGGPFTTDSLFTWREDVQSAQILSETDGKDPLTTIALMNPKVPAWIRLTIQTRTGRVTRSQMVTQGKFTTDRFYKYGVIPQITPPKTG